MESLVSIVTEWWNTTTPATWYFCFGDVDIIEFHQEAAILNSAIQITAPAF